MFISSAMAQTAANAANAGSLSSMAIQFLLIIVICYFLLIRPQQKRYKKHEAELNAIVKGVRVNVGGIIGKVVKAEPLELTVEIADGVEIKVLRPYVTQVLFNEDELLKKGSK
ncbi:MAG: preprotein translocase subunit YajC [Alphaproteobacteria bacterium]|nr:preprotein translocase subunit YajC [Alphaproteobacteria bacterium]